MELEFNIAMDGGMGVSWNGITCLSCWSKTFVSRAKAAILFFRSIIIAERSGEFGVGLLGAVG